MIEKYKFYAVFPNKPAAEKAAIGLPEKTWTDVDVRPTASGWSVEAVETDESFAKRMKRIMKLKRKCE